MNVRGLFVVFLGLQICQPASAGPLFKCEVNGRVEFTDRRCQPVKASCSERDGREARHEQCATSALEADKPPVHSPTAQSRSANATDLPGRLALNGTQSDKESRLRVSDNRYAGASFQAMGGRAENHGPR
ncbi:MAG: hypothetical protein JNN21_12020 [Candidatus Accumulibacter sp.]|nr:hypothetical protein [Accumulibacter sp.]